MVGSLLSMVLPRHFLPAVTSYITDRFCVMPRCLLKDLFCVQVEIWGLVVLSSDCNSISVCVYWDTSKKNYMNKQTWMGR